MRDDRLLLIDIVEHALFVQRAIESISKETFAADQILQYGIIHALQIIGEAARQVSQQTRATVNLPWPVVVGMRHRIVHEYFNVNLDVIWITATVDVPQLLSLLEPLIRPWIEAAKAEQKKKESP